MTPQAVRNTLRPITQISDNSNSAIQHRDSSLHINTSRVESLKGILYHSKGCAIVSSTVVLDNRLLTVIDSDDGDSQVLKIMLFYAQKGEPTIIHGTKYYPISLIKETDSLSLYSRTSEDQDIWVAKINSVSSHYSLTDKYNIGPIFYKGVNSVLREGTRISTGMKVALRIISKNKIKDYDQLKKQFDVLKMIKHNNIIKLHDIIESPTAITVVTERLEGPNLTICLTKTLKDTEIKNVVDSVASAIYTMMSYGVVHRGIQLKSIVFSSSDYSSEAKIVSFSLLSLCRHDEHLEGFKGNLRYTAPEIILHKMCDYKADVWSLGVVFYALLSGKLPFEGDSASDVMNAIVNNEPDYTRGLLAERDPDAIDLLKKMLSKDADSRIHVEDILTHRYLSVNTQKKRVKSADKLKIFKMFSKSLKKLTEQ